MGFLEELTELIFVCVFPNVFGYLDRKEYNPKIHDDNFFKTQCKKALFIIVQSIPFFLMLCFDGEETTSDVITVLNFVYVLMLQGYYIYLYKAVDTEKRKKYLIITSVISCVISVILFVFLYK